MRRLKKKVLSCGKTLINNPPIADAGPNQSVIIGDTVSLDGSGSSDPDGDRLTYEWAQIATGAPDIALSDSSAVNPTFTAAHSATGYVATFRVRVMDSGFPAMHSTDTVSIDVGLSVITECNDGIDNDGDGLTDWQYDLGCSSESDATEGGIQTDLSKFSQKDETGDYVPNDSLDHGWSVFERSPDTRVLYVSSSTGDDSWSGTLPEPNADRSDGPIKTLRQILISLKNRNGYPDWILLKRGDTWVNETFGQQYGEPGRRYGNWDKSGRSPLEPMIIASYGNTRQRPVVKPGTLEGFSVWNQKHLVIRDLEIYYSAKDPLSEEFTSAAGGTGIVAQYANENLLVENCRVICSAMLVQGAFQNVALRRNVVTRSYSASGSHSQGIYTSGSGRLLLEENVFNHNGWNDEFPLHHRHVVLGNSRPADWAKIRDGRFRIRIDNRYYNIDGVDFSFVSSMDDVAKVLENSINQTIGSPDIEVSFWKTLLLLKHIPTGGSLETISVNSEKIGNISQFIGDTSGVDLQRSEWLNGPDRCESSNEPDLPAHHKHIAPRTDLARWRTVTGGSFYAHIDGAEDYVQNVNFSAVQSMDDVASAVESAIDTKFGRDAVTVRWHKTVMLFTSNAASGASVSLGRGNTGTNIGASDWLNLEPPPDWRCPFSTVFNRNMYLSHGYGNTILRGNIDAYGASGGVQVRMGGIVEDSLYLRNPHAISFGHSENPANSTVSGTIRNNVVLGASNINTQPQGTGILAAGYESVSGGTPGFSRLENLKIYNNIVAHNELGSGNFKAFSLQGNGVHRNVDVYHNIGYNWTVPHWSSATDHRATILVLAAVNADSANVAIHDNIFQQPHSGFVASASTQPLPFGTLRLFRNTYSSAEPDSSAIWSRGWFQLGSAVTSQQWIEHMGESEYSFEPKKFVDPARNIVSYMASVGERPDYAAFIDRAVSQNRFSWDERFTSYRVNQYIRDGFAIAP